MLDMRWKDIKSYNKLRSRFNRKITPNDIVSPDEARDVSESVGLPYYECTVLSGFGVNDIFENAIRAALVYRRNSRMYTMNHLRKVREPLLQHPCLPPEPAYPELPPIVQSTFVSDLSTLSLSEESADVVLCCGSSKYFCHRLLLVQSSGLFSAFFEQQQNLIIQGLMNDLSDTGGDSDMDSEHNGENRDSNCGDVGGLKRSELFLNGLPILKALSFDYIFGSRANSTIGTSKSTSRNCGSRQNSFRNSDLIDLKEQEKMSSNCAQQVSVHGDIPRNHVTLIIHFIYHLTLPTKLNCSLIELIHTAKLFKMPALVSLLRNLSLSGDVNTLLCPSHRASIGASSCYGPMDSSRFNPTGVRSNLSVIENTNSSSSNSLNSGSSCSENNLTNPKLTNLNSDPLNDEIQTCLAKKRQEYLRNEFLKQQVTHSGNFAFHVGGEVIWVDKYLLVARSKFMESLLCGSFKESQDCHIELSDMSFEAVKVVLGYLYCDQQICKISDLETTDWCEVIEFANRLCLDRLISLVQHEFVAELKQKPLAEGIKDALVLVEKCRLFNAHGLYNWMFTHLCHNYDFMCKNCTYLKQTMLSDETKLELLRNRWPPVWYIKEKDYYERRRKLLSKVETNKRQVKNGMTRWWLWRKLNFL